MYLQFALNTEANVNRLDSIAVESWSSCFAIHESTHPHSNFFSFNPTYHQGEADLKKDRKHFIWHRGKHSAVEHPISLSDPFNSPSLVNKTTQRHTMQVATSRRGVLVIWFGMCCQLSVDSFPRSPSMISNTNTHAILACRYRDIATCSSSWPHYIGKARTRDSGLETEVKPLQQRTDSTDEFCDISILSQLRSKFICTFLYWIDLCIS